MVSPCREEVRTWLNKANQDLEAAAWLLESLTPLFSAVGFHNQQAVEKGL
jgi:HEPN domain-containing protein